VVLFGTAYGVALLDWLKETVAQEGRIDKRIFCSSRSPTIP